MDCLVWRPLGAPQPLASCFGRGSSTSDRRAAGAGGLCGMSHMAASQDPALAQWVLSVLLLTAAVLIARYARACMKAPCCHAWEIRLFDTSCDRPVFYPRGTSGRSDVGPEASLQGKRIAERAGFA